MTRTPGRALRARPPAHRGGRAALLWTALAVLAAVHALIAWYPFRLDPPGRVAVEVERLDGGTLALGGRRVVAVGTPPWAGTDVGAIESVTVDLEVRAARSMQHGPARILTVSDGYTDANLMIGQERDNLVVRVRRERSDAAGNPPVYVPHAFARGGWLRILVEVRGDGIGVEVDGLEHQIPLERSPMRTWDPGYPLLLGDERSGGRVWHGEVRRAVVSADGRALDYLAGQRLDIAERAWYLPFRLREALALPDGRARLRSLLHLVAFVPVGALLVAAARPVGLAAVVTAAGGFSVVLQVGKVALDGRHPSALTVLTQVAGALAGAALLLYLRGRCSASQWTATLRRDGGRAPQRGRPDT